MKLLFIIILSCLVLSANAQLKETLPPSVVVVGTFISIESMKVSPYNANYNLRCTQRDRVALIGMGMTVATFVITRYVIPKIFKRR